MCLLPEASPVLSPAGFVLPNFFGGWFDDTVAPCDRHLGGYSQSAETLGAQDNLGEDSTAGH